MIVRERLRLLRKINRMTQDDVADALGIPRSTYSGYEKGIRDAKYETLVAIANLFDVSIDYLLGRTDQPKENNFDDILARSLHWNGIPLSEEDLKPIRDIMKIVVNEREKTISPKKSK